MKRISGWWFGAAVVLGGALLMPSTVEAQDCLTCDGFLGECVSEEEPDDRCYDGAYDGEPFCASWGRLMCAPRFLFNDVAPDGALPRAATFALEASTSREMTAENAPWKYTRDCGSRIMGRSYATNEAADMRQRTKLIEI
ncbi:hypothetical protein [Candidatus Palauibacter sp.]|uniref:hypothetical protein n=1 Tax=Candidatus Palauibacter sp. TaxID=3101350 RepID=UPI003B018699